MPDPAVEQSHLDQFAKWLRDLGEDASALGHAVEHGEGGENARRYLTGGLNYIFKSLDLIPDGIDDIGFLDDAFVLRVACALGTEGEAERHGAVVKQLASEAEVVRAFLGADYARLETYVRGLPRGAARGRTVDDIMNEPHIRSTFIQEVTAWGRAYQSPSFTKDPRTLVKMKSFLSAKLP